MNSNTNKQVNMSINPKKDDLEHIFSQLPIQKKEIKKRSQVDKLFSELVEKVSLKQFKKAEALRIKIFEINAIATNEIIKSGILIEAGKRKFRLTKPLKVLNQSEKAFSDSENVKFAPLEKINSTKTNYQDNKSVNNLLNRI